MEQYDIFLRITRKTSYQNSDMKSIKSKLQKIHK